MWNLIKPWRSEKTVIPFNCIFNSESHGLPWSESPSPVVRLCRALACPQPLAPTVKQKYSVFAGDWWLLGGRLFQPQVDSRNCHVPRSRWCLKQALAGGEEEAWDCSVVWLKPRLCLLHLEGVSFSIPCCRSGASPAAEQGPGCPGSSWQARGRFNEQWTERGLLQEL